MGNHTYLNSANNFGSNFIYFRKIILLPIYLNKIHLKIKAKIQSSSQDYNVDNKARLNNEAADMKSSEKDILRKRKSDLIEFEYEGDFRQQTNMKPLVERKISAMSNLICNFF